MNGISEERAVARAVVDRIAVSRGLPAPWASEITALPGWLDGADVTAWGVVELGEMRQKLLDPRKRDAHGIVYTPSQVVEFQVRAALHAADLDRAAGHRRPLEHITLHDPFCGPGIFLIHAAQHLAAWCLKWADAPSDVPQDMIRAVTAEAMTESIYGTDLDEVAIDIAKSVCWLEIGGIRPIDFMDDNIVVGDTFKDELPPKLAKRWPIAV